MAEIDIAPNLASIKTEPGLEVSPSKELHRCDSCRFTSEDSHRLFLHIKCYHPEVIKNGQIEISALELIARQNRQQYQQVKQEHKGRRGVRHFVGAPVPFHCDQCGEGCRDEAELMIHSWTHLPKRAGSTEGETKVRTACTRPTLILGQQRGMGQRHREGPPNDAGGGRGKGVRRTPKETSVTRTETREERRLRREREREERLRVAAKLKAMKSECLTTSDGDDTSAHGVQVGGAALLRARQLPMEADALVNFSDMVSASRKTRHRTAADVARCLSEPEPYFGVRPSDLPTNQLPSCGQVIGRLLKTRLEEMRRRGVPETCVPIQGCVRRVAKEVWRLWQAAGVPVVSLQRTCTKLLALWHARDPVRKTDGRRAIGEHQRRQKDALRQRMATLFDISCRSRVQEGSDAQRFLEDQRTLRRMYIDAFGALVPDTLRSRTEATATGEAAEQAHKEADGGCDVKSGEGCREENGEASELAATLWSLDVPENANGVGGSDADYSGSVIKERC